VSFSQGSRKKGRLLSVLLGNKLGVRVRPLRLLTEHPSLVGGPRLSSGGVWSGRTEWKIGHSSRSLLVLGGIRV